MKKARLNRRVLFLKVISIAIAIMIVTSSTAILRLMIKAPSENEIKSRFDIQSIPTRPCQVKTVLSQAIPWVSFDSNRTAPGTPAEAHVIISDTTGITIVADFYGFWKGDYNISSITYDDLDMPGASSINEPGKPMLPVLTELVEIPHDIDVSLEVLNSSSDTDRGYNIRPAPPLYFPVGIYDGYPNATPQFTIPSQTFDQVYTEDAFFPSVNTNASGKTGATPLIMRGHRLLQLSFCPVRYNHRERTIEAFSQIVVKLKYSSPAQIRPVPERLRSDIFERLLKRSLLHYDPVHIIQPQQPGHPISYIRTDLPPSMPNATVPLFHQSSIATGKEPGAEYLIITTGAFKDQAQKLADWKERKGTTSRVEIIPDRNEREEKIRNVKGIINYAYENWDLVPTYVLLFGDVEAIPANYDLKHTGSGGAGPYFDSGFFASDLGYFTVDGTGFLPDIIYSRISVDTERQAEIAVNKILQYEQAPPEKESFYESILTTGYFQDKPPIRDGTEDSAAPFLFHLESIRQYLLNLGQGYIVYYNYSGAADSSRDDYKEAEKFCAPLQIEFGSEYLSYYGLSDSQWIWSYPNEKHRYDGNTNITANINDGRFLVMYYGHGGSKNMIYPYDLPYTTNNRDYTEGWFSPCFNTSYFSLLDNEDRTPLILSMACSTGWYDGETDQLYCELYRSGSLEGFSENAFALYGTECFAENITRMDEGGAIAVIAPSRPAPADISGDLLDGIIQSFWPGFLGSENQPIYEMGGALHLGKLYALEGWSNTWSLEVYYEMVNQGFHLFGDPETQLWTGSPSEFNVSYPEIIGTQGDQSFVVTVKDNVTDKPVINAKVCVQQIPDIYLVGGSDSKGQVIFNVDPKDIAGSLNVTVTKHNYVPHIGEIHTEEISEATITVSEVSLDQYIDITFEGFAEQIEVQIFFDEAIVPDASVFPSPSPVTIPVPEGLPKYVTVTAVQGNTIATGYFYRLSTDETPDPYIYSLEDDTTWHLADGKRVYDNPCITIYDGTTPADHLEQGKTYDVVVTVYNRGYVDAANTSVTLWYLPSGRATWDEIRSERLEIPHAIGYTSTIGYNTVSFTWQPQFSNTARLKITIEEYYENPEDEINNMGTECWNVFPLCSVGESTFEVGNPSDDTDYVTIDVRQDGEHEDVWSASVQDYPCQSLEPGDTEEATLVVDPGRNVGPEDDRTFTAEISVNDEMILGLEFSGYCESFYRFLIAIIILVVFFIAIVALIWWARKN